jgi:hypothetical protein
MPLEEELESLNVRIRTLRVQFDLFFSGALPKPPLEMRDHLDKEVKRVGTSREMKLAQRFLYNTLLNRWNIFTELWNKRLKEREEGIRTPAAARRRSLVADSRSARTPAPGPGAPPPRKGPAPDRRLVARAAIRDAVDATGDNMKAFYKSFLEARQETGNGKPPSYERFCQQIEKQARTIREKTACSKVDFRLYLEENKVSVKARPVKDIGTEDPEETRG